MKLRQDPTAHPLGSQVEAIAMSFSVDAGKSAYGRGAEVMAPEKFLDALCEFWAAPDIELITLIGHDIHNKLQALMLQTLERGRAYPFWLDRTDLRIPVRVYNVAPTLHTITNEQFFGMLGMQGPPTHLSGKPAGDLAKSEHKFVVDLASKLMF